MCFKSISSKPHKPVLIDPPNMAAIKCQEIHYLIKYTYTSSFQKELMKFLS